MTLKAFSERFVFSVTSMFPGIMASLGAFVGQNPLICLCGPMTIAIFVFTAAFNNWSHEARLEELFMPFDSKALKDRPLLEHLFPVDYGSFFPGHETKIDDPQLVIMVETDDAGAFSESVWNLLSEIDSLITSHPGYAATCARAQSPGNTGAQGGESSAQSDIRNVNDVSECAGNDFLELRPHLDAYRNRAMNISFPRTTFERKEYNLQMHFGGVSIDLDPKGTEVLSNAKVIRLSYPLDPSCTKTGKVEKELWHDISSYASTSNFSILHVHSQSMKEELQFNLYKIDPLMSAVLLMILTVLFSLWDGAVSVATHIAGTGVVVLAIGVGFGLAAIQTYQWHIVTLAGFCVVLGVGMDDVFVMTNAFRRTNPTLSVPERLSKSYEEAAVSITLTSATNAAAFIIGAVTANYGTVRLFCVYCGWAVGAIYFFTVVMFGSVIACAALAEQWLKTKAWYSEVVYCCSHSIDGMFSYLTRKIFHLPEGYDMALAWGKWLSSIGNLTIVAGVFFAYLVMSLFYAVQLPKGIMPSRLFDEASYAHQFYDLEFEMFLHFRFRLHVVIPHQIDFADLDARNQIEVLLSRIRNTTMVSNNVGVLEENWMERFQKWSGDNWDTFEEDIEAFLIDMKGTRDAYNIKLSGDDAKSNIASRFFLQSGTVSTPDDMTMFLGEVRAEARDAPFPVMVFNPFFAWFDQLASVQRDTIMSCVLCFVTIATVTYLLLFNITAVMFICLMIISVYVGVLGCMSALRVNFDFVSMICLIMSAGFSVDFSVHITQHYILSQGREEATNKITSAIRAYGISILQSAASTTIVVVPLLSPASYILQSFSKIVIATVSLGAIHGLLVLPTFLAAFYDPPNQGIVRLTNIFGPVGGVKGAVMSIRRRIVQSTDVMDSWAPDVGTYRPILFGRLLESQIEEKSEKVAAPDKSQERGDPSPSPWPIHECTRHGESTDRESTGIEDNRFFELRNHLSEISLEDESFDLGII